MDMLLRILSPASILTNKQHCRVPSSWPFRTVSISSVGSAAKFVNTVDCPGWVYQGLVMYVNLANLEHVSCPEYGWMRDGLLKLA